MKKFLKITFFCLSVICVFALSGVAYFEAVTFSTTLDSDALESEAVSCTILDVSGNRIKIGDAEYVEIDKTPKNLRNAFVAIEDKRFFEHGGVDVRGVFRAIKNDLFARKVKEGASTITQQLAKNVFLSGEKTLNRKLKEIKLALLLEKHYTKNQILQAYLNKIYFGEGAYGVASAADVYFDKSVEDLDVAQCATLAAIVKAPTAYNPYNSADKCLKRRNLVLKRMFEQKMLSDEEYSSAISQPLNLSRKGINTQRRVTSAILGEALDFLGLTTISDLNGYTIYTAIDQEFQSRLPSATDYSLSYDYATLVVDNDSRGVVAYASNASELRRCPASAAKPWLVYAPAIEKRLISQATKILDEKTTFGDYSPSNYSQTYHGYVSVKESLIRSLNVPSVKIGEMLGVGEMRRTARQLGVEFTNDDLSVALGNLSGGTTLIQLASAYSPFSHSGYYSPYSFVTRIKSPKGKVVYSQGLPRRVFSRGTCDVINDILKDVASRGTAKKLSSLGFTVYAKTGTNGTKSGNIDAYCVAYTPEYTVAVWIGNADDSPMPNKVSGGTYPTAIAADIFAKLYADSNPSEFSSSDEVTRVDLDKKSYDENHELLLSDGKERECRSFLFLKGSEPTVYCKSIEKQNVKDCKITYNNLNITIFINCKDEDAYAIYDDKRNLIFRGKGSKEYVVDNLTPDSIYSFSVEFDDGENIKLPSVKTDGKKIISDWWNDC